MKRINEKEVAIRDAKERNLRQRLPMSDDK